MDAINFSDIIEKNKKTVKENNLEIDHNIPLGTLVEVKFDTWHGKGACEKVHARLYVVAHNRDCDGTPLYSLCRVKVQELTDKFQVSFIDGDTGEPHTFNNEYSTAMVWNVHHGFDEEGLTPIEVTKDIEDGAGSLDWKEEE